jgi:glycosyltransferase involved in cell wall biosynthesis
MDGGSQLKLLIVSQYFWPEDFRINELASAMQARGHEVTVLTSIPNYPAGVADPAYISNPSDFARYQGVEVVRVPQVVRGQGKLRLVLNYLSFALSACTIGAWRLRGRSADAVFVFQTSPVTVGIPGGLLAAIKRAPMLMWILDCWPETLKAIGIGGGAFAQSAVGLLVRVIYASADLLLGQSMGFKANVARYSKAAKFRHFPNWVEEVYIKAPNPRATKPGDAFVVLYAGNIGEAQDFPTVVAAAETLRDDSIRFCIVGDGRDLQRMKTDVAARGLEEMFEFAGRHPPDAMPDFFAQADALLVCLKSDPLFAMTVPGKVQTYLAAGRPIVAMLDGEGAEVVRDAGAGYAVAAGDAPALSNAISQLAATPLEERLQMAARGRAFAEKHYKFSDLLAKLEQWIDEVRLKERVEPSR